jgi:NTE family protein
MKWPRKRIGLALGGGGARGLSHIGVLRVFEQANIPIDIIAGTSIGAMVGGAYASGISTEELESLVQEYVNSTEFQSSTVKSMADVYNREKDHLKHKIQSFLKNQIYILQMLFKPGILSPHDFQIMINYFIPDIQIQDTIIPFRAIATDLISGEQIVFSQGPLRKAVLASCAVPGVIEPIQEGDKLLSDGGIVSLIPVRVARDEGADIVIAVVVDNDIRTDDELKTVKDIYYRACEITSAKLEAYDLMDADIVIRPDVKNLHWTSFSKAVDLVSEGEKAAQQMLPRILNKRSYIRTLMNSIKTIGVSKS